MSADKPKAAGRHNYQEQYGVIVICRDEKDQRRIYEKLRRQGLTVKVVTT